MFSHLSANTDYDGVTLVFGDWVPPKPVRYVGILTALGRMHDEAKNLVGFLKHFLLKGGTFLFAECISSDYHSRII